MASEELKPRCALRVGVVGNRRFDEETDEQPTALAEEMKKHAESALDAVWQVFLGSIDAALEYPVPRADNKTGQMRDFFSLETPRLAVLSSLAAGADQIGAFAALRAAKGLTNVSLQLEALLPMSENDYPGLPSATRKEFRTGEAATLRELSGSAAQVVRLPGDYGTETSRRNAYRQARDLLLQNSDILVAMYDPTRGGGVAGTVETIRRALKSEIPVVAILTAAAEARIQVVRRVEHHAEMAIRWEDAAAVEDEAWRVRLLACVEEQLVLPELLAHDQEGDEEPGEGGRIVEHALFRLGMISGAERPPAFCRNRFGAAIFSAIWATLQRLAFAAARPQFRERLERAQNSAEALIRLDPYRRFYDRASILAVDYMRTYRGAFVASYLLAGAAVAAAVSLMAVSLLIRNTPHHVIFALCAVKIGILLLLLKLESMGYRGRFQEAGADFRYLAELLRPMQWLTPLGTYPPGVDLPLHATRHDPRRKWMAWLARAIARSVPCIAADQKDRAGVSSKTITISAEDAADALDRARTEWIGGQVAYHYRQAARMHILENGLERLAKGLLLTVLAAAVIACVIEWREEPTEVPSLARTVSVVFSAFAAFLPAWIAAFAGITVQSEAKRLAGISDAMYHALQWQQKELDAAANRIRAMGMAESDAVSTAADALRTASAITIREASDWKVLYEAHAIHAA